MTPTTPGADSPINALQEGQAAGPPPLGPGSALQGLLCWQVKHSYFLVLPWLSVSTPVHLVNLDELFIYD